MEKGKLSNEYSGIIIKIVSECEWQMSQHLLYRDPISAIAALDEIKWQRECPKVSWDETTLNTYLYFVASEATSDILDLKVMNPDPLNIWTSDKYDNTGEVITGWDTNKDHLVHPNVEFVRVQFRRPGVGEWINAWDDAKDSANLMCAHSLSGCSLAWSLTLQYFMNGLRDGAWEIRGKIFCSGYAATAPISVRGSTTDENLNLFVDVTPPKPLRTSVMGKLVVVEYTEVVVCPQLKSNEPVYHIRRTHDCDNATENVSPVDWTTISLQYKFRCISDKINAWTMELPSDSKTGKYTIEIQSDAGDGVLADEAGNTAAPLQLEINFCDSSTAAAAIGSSSLKASMGHVDDVLLKPAQLGNDSKKHLRASFKSTKSKSATLGNLKAWAKSTPTLEMSSVLPNALSHGFVVPVFITMTIAATIVIMAVRKSLKDSKISRFLVPFSTTGRRTYGSV